jgi:hypothetical protein
MPSDAMTSIVGSLADGSALVTAQAPAMAMGMTYVAMADSIALVMENAAAAQQRGQVLAAAAVAQVLVMILVKGSTPMKGAHQ